MDLAHTAWISILGGTFSALALASPAAAAHARRLLEPYLYTSRFRSRAVWIRLSHELDASSTWADVCRLIPARAADITGVEPVTLFLALNGDPEFKVREARCPFPPSVWAWTSL